MKPLVGALLIEQDDEWLPTRAIGYLFQESIALVLEDQGRG